MKDELAQKKCIPCSGAVPPVRGEELRNLLVRLKGGWEAITEHHLRKEFAFNDFKEALTFTNRIGELAEREGHHPDIHLSWGNVVVEIYTHKINGLTESDFILAAKIDEVQLE